MKRLMNISEVRGRWPGLYKAAINTLSTSMEVQKREWKKVHTTFSTRAFESIRETDLTLERL